jgi:hypothetical protein
MGDKPISLGVAFILPSHNKVTKHTEQKFANVGNRCGKNVH